YTPAANEDGTAIINVYAAHEEVHDISGHDSGTLTYEHSYNVTVTAQPDALSIIGSNNNDGDNEPLTVTATGDEDTLIAIPYQ
ncbi:hypothetical protein SB749_20225, partial [Brevibacterium sp. SIMBA_078]|uniref:hypothetical protein n=1 Tax=Brevibacterium sp. SIMBA_078 TaxID=3085816 RepID=UPI00397B2C1B